MMALSQSRVLPRWAVLCGGLLACSSTPKPEVKAPATAAKGAKSVQKDLAEKLLVPSQSYDFQSNPKLLKRILAGPHGYFRFINVKFAEAVCERFHESYQGVPPVNLHGDAHLEQYAVTDLGRGLTDFDDSSTGPAVLDLIRFGVSLKLAAEKLGWQKDSKAFFEDFLAGYQAALKDPKIDAVEPEVAKKIRATFKYDRKGYFEWIDSIAEPVPADETQALIEALKPYVAAMHQEKKVPEDFFKVVKIGYLRMGIGSALDLKYLVRVQGATAEPADDVVLEIKQVRSLSGISCISGSKVLDPFRILVGQSRIAYKPYDYLGYIRFKKQTFWIHSWVDNYREVKIAKSFKTQEALRKVVYDIGVQLGRGHPNQIAAPLDLQLSNAQLDYPQRNQAFIVDELENFTEASTEAWRRFTAQFPEK